MSRVYEEVVEFLARGTTSDDIASWQPSQRAKDRVAELIRAEKDGTLSPDNLDELNHYFELEHIMRLAKARARRLGGATE